MRAEEAQKMAEEEERRIEEEVRKKLEAEEKAKEVAIAVRAKMSALLGRFSNRSDTYMGLNHLK